MKRSEIIRFLILRSIGNFLILFSLFGVLMTFGPALYEEARYRIDVVQGIKYVVQDPNVTPTPAQSLLVDSRQKILIPKDLEFSVLIPKIGANAEVIPNVDPTNETEYRAALQKGIAHAKGSVFPGMQGTTYLFAHSTDNWYDVGRYNAVFYLLKDLVPGDQVTVFFANKRYDYKVDYTQIVDPSDVDLLVHAQTTRQQLVLQTCWPPGTTFKRLLVVAQPDKVSSE